jgi:hypothetical protein
MYLVFGILLILFLISVLFYIFQPLGEQFYIISDLTVIIFSFLAFVFGLYTYKFYGFGSVKGKALLFLTLGVFFWFLGETTWGIYEIVLGVKEPIASIADMFWLIGYPLFLMGFYYVWKIASTSISKKRLMILSVSIIAVCSFMAYITTPILTDTEMSFAGKISTAGYVIGDMLILIALMIAVTYLFGGKFAKGWSIILLSVFMMSAADIYYMNFLEVYETGSLIDIFWNLSYILLAFGFFYHREVVKEVFDGIKKK